MPEETPNTPAAETPESDAEAVMNALLVKQDGDLAKVARQLLEQTHTLRAKNRDLREQLKGKDLPEGAVVLGRDDAQAFDRYKALGNPEELSAALSERNQFKDELEKGRKATLNQQAAKAHEYKVPVLSRLVSQDNVQLEVREETVSGKPTPVAYVKEVDAAGKETSTKLPDYAAKHWPDFLDSLADKPASPTLGTPTPASPFPPSRGIPAVDPNAPSLVNW